MSDPLRLLLVEDEPVQRQLLERRLEKAGYQVETARNGDEALAKIMKDPFALLVTDWDMPGMDGAALCRHVREARLPGYLYILLLTNYDSTADIVTGLEAGADDYIRKPANEAELLARLKAGRRIVELTRQVQLLSITDPLVGTFNRRYLTDQLTLEIERARRYARPLAIVIADLDGFKLINDTYGHLIGDEVLQGFAERVRSCIRQNDWIARYGGEEFVIALPDTNLPAAMVTAEKVRARCESASMATSAGDVPVTASFGVTALECLPSTPCATMSDLLRQADAALYRSKNAGRNRVTAGDMLA